MMDGWLYEKVNENNQLLKYLVNELESSKKKADDKKTR
jgi:hypothetical protein